MAGESHSGPNFAEEEWGNSPLEVEDNLRLAFEDVARNIYDPKQRQSIINELFEGARLADVPTSVVIQVYEQVRSSSPELSSVLDLIEIEVSQEHPPQYLPEPNSDTDYDEGDDRLRNVS